ncbi:IS3 family transposase [Companilactobacillus kimchii]|uniref:IS3 family transposase n=1 Tax=Companilactobacillus kimchii TaxID=2801452 RepID=UPI0009EBA008
MPQLRFLICSKEKCLYGYNIDDLAELKNLVVKYINWYNNKRISLKKNGLSP